MTPDPFRHDDAAYLLGALSRDERAAFEQHLAGCPACTARIEEIAALPPLLSGLSAADLDDDSLPDEVPASLWPALVRRAAAERRRRHWLTGGLAGVAAACAAALIVALWPSSASAPARPQAMTAVATSPVQASAALVTKPWGTEIDLVCHYDAGAPSGYPYALTVVDRNGTVDELGTWTLVPGTPTRFSSGTALPLDQIAGVQITAAGRTILQLVR